ncbi:MAG: hypothetical protein P4L61_01080 [Candidatus Pacebacteria bacterium]|nr:hypothetical protein [Candidatus Paceibacterota bacterium]
MKSTPVKEKVTLAAIGRLIERSIAKLATKEEMNIAVSKLATKDELNNAVFKLATKAELLNAVSMLATKAEISKLATKAELSNAVSMLATKEEVAKLPTRNEMDASINNAVDDLAGAVKKGFDEVDKKFDLVFERLDSLEEKSATKTDLYEAETSLGDKILKLEGSIDKIYNFLGKAEVRAENIDSIVLTDHGPRIRALEKEVGI